MGQSHKCVFCFTVILIITGNFIFQGALQGTSIERNIAFIKQLSRMVIFANRTDKYSNHFTENFEVLQKPVPWTEQSNGGSLYNFIPKEILFDSTQNVTAKLLVESDSNETHRNIVVNGTQFQSISARKISLKYPYNPFMNRTFGAEELENEKFTGTKLFLIDLKMILIWKKRIKLIAIWHLTEDVLKN